MVPRTVHSSNTHKHAPNTRHLAPNLGAHASIQRPCKHPDNPHPQLFSSFANNTQATMLLLWSSLSLWWRYWWRDRECIWRVAIRLSNWFGSNRWREELVEWAAGIWSWRNGTRVTTSLGPLRLRLLCEICRSRRLGVWWPCRLWPDHGRCIERVIRTKRSQWCWVKMRRCKWMSRRFRGCSWWMRSSWSRMMRLMMMKMVMLTILVWCCCKCSRCTRCEVVGERELWF